MLRREKIEHENATTQINSWYYQGFKIVRMDRIKRRCMDSALAFANGSGFVVLNKYSDIEFECDNIVEALDNIDTYETGSNFRYRGYDVEYSTVMDTYTLAVSRGHIGNIIQAEPRSFKCIIAMKRYIDSLYGEVSTPVSA